MKSFPQHLTRSLLFKQLRAVLVGAPAINNRSDVASRGSQSEPRPASWLCFRQTTKTHLIQQFELLSVDAEQAFSPPLLESVSGLY